MRSVRGGGNTSSASIPLTLADMDSQGKLKKGTTIVTAAFGAGDWTRLGATGFLLIVAVALILFAGIREQLDLTGTPRGMKGVPIALVTAGILAMAFMGFNGLVPLP